MNKKILISTSALMLTGLCATQQVDAAINGCNPGKVITGECVVDDSGGLVPADEYTPGGGSKPKPKPKPVVWNGWHGGKYYVDDVYLTNTTTWDGYYVGSSGYKIRGEKDPDGCMRDYSGHVANDEEIGGVYYEYGYVGRYTWNNSHTHYYGWNGTRKTNAWEGDYWLNSSGNLTRNTWHGSYWMDYSGKITKDAWGNGGLNYFDSSGDKVTNSWVDGANYFVDGNGYIYKNKWIGDAYLGSSGKRKRNEYFRTGGYKYYANSSGNIVRNGWGGSNGIYDYYMDGSGHITRNAWVDGGNYYVGSNGYKFRNRWYENRYLGNDGKMWRQKWHKGTGFYSKKDGFKAQNEWITHTNNISYHINGSCVRDRNKWITGLNGSERWVNSRGEMQESKWMRHPQHRDKWIYFYEGGELAKNAWIQGDYYVDGDGTMVTKQNTPGGRLDLNGVTYFVDNSGKYIRHQWVGKYYCQKYGQAVEQGWIKDMYGKWKYVKNGKFVTNSLVDNGYFVGENGYLLTDTHHTHKGNSYYLDNTGHYIFNTFRTEVSRAGKVFHMFYGPKGTLVKNAWVSYLGDYYYIDGNGCRVDNKTVKNGDSVGILKKDGKAARREFYEGKYYNADARLVKNSWVMHENNWFYIDGNGECLKNAKLEWGNYTYLFGPQGYIRRVY